MFVLLPMILRFEHILESVTKFTSSSVFMILASEIGEWLYQQIYSN